METKKKNLFYIKWLLGGVTLILLLFIDQLTKYTILHSIGQNGHVIKVLKGIFSFQYLENEGAAFGILQNQQVFFVVITVAILLFLVYFYKQLPEEKKYLPLHIITIFITAGAAGNFIDRLIRGYVIDFIRLDFMDFPIFNVADCYVTVSACILIPLVLFYYKDEDFTFLVKQK